MQPLALLLFICLNVTLGCINKGTSPEPVVKEDFDTSHLPPAKNKSDSLERRKIGRWHYSGWANALNNDAVWYAFPYFFQPVGKSTAVLELKELRLPDGIQVGNLTFNRLPLKKADYCCTEFDRTEVIYTIMRHNGCAVKGFYIPVNSNAFHSTFSIMSYDSSTTELLLNFDILFKVRTADRIQHPDLPEFIYFKNGNVRTKSIR